MCVLCGRAATWSLSASSDASAYGSSPMSISTRSVHSSMRVPVRAERSSKQRTPGRSELSTAVSYATSCPSSPTEMRRIV